MARFRLVKSLGTVVPVNPHISLHRDHRHAKCPYDFLRLDRARGDQLAGEHAETLHVSLCMLEYRHVTVDVPYRARILLHRDLAVDLGHSSMDSLAVTVAASFV